VGAGQAHPPRVAEEAPQLPTPSRARLASTALAFALLATVIVAASVWGRAALPAAPLLPCLLTLIVIKKKARR
jgi:hypothetical protein